MPFTAPEVLVEGKYNGRAADMWSLGIVLIEVHCGVKILERALNLGTEGSHSDTNMVKNIRAAFEQPDSVQDFLTSYCRPELQTMLVWAMPMIRGMLVVNFGRRWTAPDLLESLRSARQR